MGGGDSNSGRAGPRERLKQVWLPGSGVWAAAPAERSGSESPERRRKSRKRSRGAAGQQREAAPPAAAAAEVPPETRAAAAAPLVHYTGFDLQQDHEASDVEEVEPAPTCPICLTDIIELSDKAVVTACMHTFCHDCISRWLSHHKRFCPLCKARVTSVLYDITAAGTFKEREVPPSPKLVTAGSGQGQEDAGLLQRLQDFLGVAGLLDPYEQQQARHRTGGGGRGSSSGSGAQRLRSQAGSGRIGYGASRQPAAGGIQQAQAVVAGGAAQQGPRPYFWRLQQRLQAGAYRPGDMSGLGASIDGGEAGEGPVSEEDYVLLWRRQIYDQDLWAVPLGSEAARISLGSGSARERRLTEWIDRELRALLQTDDTTIVRGFVMGLLVAYGIEPFPRSSAAAAAGGGAATGGGPGGGAGQQSGPPAAPAAAAAAASRRAAEMVAAARRGGGVAVSGRAVRSSGAGGSTGGPRAGSTGSSGSAAGAAGAALSSSPQDALRPFLHEHSEHFWHELRCFATAPYSIRTYDQMVTYLRQQAEPAPAAAPAAAAGARSLPATRGTVASAAAAAAAVGNGPPARASRWDQRRQAAGMPAASVQHRQQQWGTRAVQPARLVRQAPAGSEQRQQQQQQQQQGALYPLAADAEVIRTSRSRNPSPPPLRGGPAVAAAPSGLPFGARQQQQQHKAQQQHPQQQEQAEEPRSGIQRGRSRSRSRSRHLHKPRPRRRSSSSAQHGSRCSSRKHRHRHRRRSTSYDRSRSPRSSSRHGRRRQRSPSCSRSPSLRRARGRDRSREGWPRYERHEWDGHSACYGTSGSRRPGLEAYLVGEDDAGDRWCMD